MSAEDEQSPSSGTTTPTASEKSGRRTAWRPLIGGLVIAFVMVVIMATNYVWSGHGVVAHNLPWGEVGSSALTDAVSQDIRMKITQYDSEADLEQAANESKIYGGFVADSNTLILSEAASSLGAGHALYFGGNQIMWPIITLLIYAVLGAAIVTFFSWGRLRWWKAKRPPRPIGPDEEIAAAAIPPG